MQNTKASIFRPYGHGLLPTTAGGFGHFGFAISNGGWNYGKAAGDNYYIGVDSSGNLYAGVQVNNATEITWTKIHTS